MRLRLAIDGMLSVHAKRALFTALSGVAGVSRADVRMGSAVLECDGRVHEDELRAAVETAGCRVASIRRELPTI